MTVNVTRYDENIAVKFEVAHFFIIQNPMLSRALIRVLQNKLNNTRFKIGCSVYNYIVSVAEKNSVQPT